jgi:hypothetical protein
MVIRLLFFPSSNFDSLNMRITKDDINEKTLYNAGENVMVTTGEDCGIFVKYRGSGDILYKTSAGILKSVNVFTSNVYLNNL